MSQEIFKTQYVEELRRNVKDNKNVKFYESDIFEYDTNQVLISPLIEKLENTKLLVPDESSKYDLENSIILYKQFKKLTPLQASDIRLWTYLAHVDYFEYMSKRWSSVKNKESKNPSKYILDHWFISSTSQSSFIRHGIAGLWWAAYLSYDENRPDPFELTKILFTQIDFATRTLGIYVLARHKEAVIGILEFISENKEIFITRFEEKSRYITKYMNQLGGTKPLTFFDRKYFKENLKNIILKLKSI